MKVAMFAIMDGKAKAFLQPFCMMTEAMAVRSFKSAVNTPDHDFCKFSEDFTLFRVGTFDDATGVIEPLGPEVVCNGIQVKESPRA